MEMGYAEHWARSMKYSWRFFSLWITSLIHAFAPNIFMRTARTSIEKMHAEIT
jgi:hypothetical protein